MAKIVVLTNAIGGLWVFRAELMEKIIKSGYELTICCPEGDKIENFEKMGSKVLVTKKLNRRGINILQDAGLVLEYWKMLKAEKPDVVLSYTIKPNVYGGMVCRLMRLPYIVNVTGIGTAISGKGMLARLCMLLYKLGLGGARKVFFQNSSNMELFLENGIAINRNRLIPGSGVNLEKHSLKAYPDGEKVGFLFVGRVMKAKGIEEFLYAAEKIGKEYENVSFCLCGICEEEAYLNRIKSLSEKIDFRYMGRVDNIDDYYEAAHCIVLPSYHEGTANVLLEGQANGRPVIATRVPGCKETFVENVSGFGCEAKDKEGLYEAMKRMLELSCEERRSMGLRGREKVERDYDRSIVIDAYMEEINKILGE